VSIASTMYTQKCTQKSIQAHMCFADFTMYTQKCTQKSIQAHMCFADFIQNVKS